MNSSDYQYAAQHIKSCIDRADRSIWNRRHSVSLKVADCDNGTEIWVSFPGDKATISNRNSGKFRYDFRVIIKNPVSNEGAVLSHADIAGLLFIAVRAGLIKRGYLTKQLIRLGTNGTFEQLTTSAVIIAPDVSEMISRGYRAMGKAPPTVFQRPIEIGTLLDATFWILVQEELNYPMPNYQGRKMAIKRFLEAIHCTGSDQLILEEVVKRLLSHGKRPDDLPFVDYLGIEQIRPLEVPGIHSSIEQTTGKYAQRNGCKGHYEEYSIIRYRISFVERIRGWLGI